LEAIDHPSRESYAQAYVYALLCFVASLLQSLLDQQRIWHGRRAATRVTSELQAAIFEKSLKRKDFSGTVDKEKEAAAKEAREKKLAATSASTTAPSTSQSGDSNGRGKKVI
jgi:hypothetical protein